MSISEKILYEVKVGETYRPKDFYPLGSPKGIDRALARMIESGQVERVARGQYQFGAQKSGMAVQQAILTSRAELFDRIGIGFDGKRDNWKALGYDRTISFKNYFQAYQRGDIAQRIVDAPAKATWRNPPQVSDEEGEDGAFAEAWSLLLDEFGLYRELERADIRARIGKFGLLFLGLPGEFEKPARKTGKLLYVSSFTEAKVGIKEFVTDVHDPRFGLPSLYQINMQGSLGEVSLSSRVVHHSRAIHLAEDSIEDDIFGKPALEAVFNRLFDMEKVVGGAAEGVWKTFDRGLFLKLAADADMDEKSLAEFDDNVEKYVHGLQRVIKGQGMDIEQLGTAAPDPRGHFQVLASIISGTTGIPQRILFGSERGQLASSMDERNWNSRIKERQVTFAEPMILRPLLNRFVSLGILPESVGTIEIDWPDLNALTENEKLQNAKLLAQAARNLVDREKGLTFLSDSEKRRILGFGPEMAGDSSA